MKKFVLVLIFVMLFSLCACSTENTIDNPNTSSNINISSSNTTSIKDDFTLPERDDPTSSSTSNSNNNNSSFNQYHDQDNTSSQLTVTKRLHLEVEKPYYTSSAIMINLVLSCETGKFNYYTDFFLQKYENGKWDYYTTTNDIIDYKFNVASSDSNVAFVTYDIRKLYTAPIPTGTYRFIQESDNGKLVSNSFEIVDNNISENEQ